MIRKILLALHRDKSAVAMMEFALVLPPLILMSLTGAEITHYVTTKMRISQLALHVADNAARMGTGSLLSAKKVSEADINDVFTGAGLQAGELALYTKGRVIISDLEPIANPNPTNKYKIVWQRCQGAKTSHLPSYGVANDTNLDGIGPAGAQVTAQDDNATMFVEIYYEYTPLIGVGNRAPSLTMVQIASMSVRDRRDLSDDSAASPNFHPKGVYKVTGVTPSTC